MGWGYVLRGKKNIRSGACSLKKNSEQLTPMHVATRLWQVKGIFCGMSM